MSRTDRHPGWGRCQRGFTLAEIAIALVIIAILLGGLVMPLTAQIDLRNVTDANNTISDIRDALIGFAASRQADDGKPYLPCPDTDNDGVENRSAGGSCVSPEGGIPWVDLGLGREDAWGNRFRYRVASSYSSRQTGFTLSTPASLQACRTASCSSGSILAIGVPAVVLSHGKNGAGAINSSGTTNPAPSDADEIENADNDNNFVSHELSPGFDDVVSWLSPNILYYRMIAASRLP